MKNFIRKTFVFSILALLFYAIVMLFANGSHAPTYNKFTSAKQQSLVIGTSRALMGIDPCQLNKKLKPATPIYNFAITEMQSSFGEVYYRAIKKKLESTSYNSIFIIAVDPWSISIDKRIEEENVKYKEQGSNLDLVKNINQNPNIEYLFQTYSLSWGSMFVNMAINDDPNWLPQQNGWLKVDEKYDSATFEPRIEDKIKWFKNDKLPNFEFSKFRYQYLCKTIEVLKKHGEVYLVRIPVHRGIREIEKQYMPDFDQRMSELSAKYSIAYFYNFNNADYYFYDGHHLIAESATEFSKALIKKISKYLHKE